MIDETPPLWERPDGIWILDIRSYRDGLRGKPPIELELLSDDVEVNREDLIQIAVSKVVGIEGDEAKVESEIFWCEILGFLPQEDEETWLAICSQHLHITDQIKSRTILEVKRYNIINIASKIDD